MNSEIKAQVKQHALSDPTNEVCGFVCVDGFGKVTVMPCENLARNKAGRFAIDPKKNLEAERLGHVAAFYHSHASEFIRAEADRFSKEDLDISYESALPALLYVHPNDTWHYNLPSTYRPMQLLGRPFIWGVWDCYSLVRDYYLMHKGIKLGSYMPPDNATVTSNFDYEGRVKNENFHEIPLSDLREGDVILFKIKSNFCNHSAVYLGGNEYLHQPINKISSKAVLDDRIQKYIVKTLRHND